jgi:hypothetical protein
VNRDVLQFRYILNSEEDPDKITFDTFITSWDKTGIVL